MHAQGYAPQSRSKVQVILRLAIPDMSNLVLERMARRPLSPCPPQCQPEVSQQSRSASAGASSGRASRRAGRAGGPSRGRGRADVRGRRAGRTHDGRAEAPRLGDRPVAHDRAPARVAAAARVGRRVARRRGWRSASCRLCCSCFWLLARASVRDALLCCIAAACSPDGRGLSIRNHPTERRARQGGSQDEVLHTHGLTDIHASTASCRSSRLTNSTSATNTSSPFARPPPVNKKSTQPPGKALLSRPLAREQAIKIPPMLTSPAGRYD